MSRHKDRIEVTAFAVPESVVHPTLDRCQQLQEALDELLAGYLLAHPERVPANSNALEILVWNHARIRALEEMEAQHG